MSKIMHVQTVLMENEIAELKKKAKEVTTKEALAAAVHHYLECENTHEDAWAKKIEKLVQKRQKLQKNN